MIDQHVGASLAALLAAVGLGFAAAGQVDYTGQVSLGTGLILLTLAATTLWNRHKSDTAKMLREQTEDWRSRCEELTAKNRELESRPDMATVMEVLREQQRVIDTLVQGSSEMSRQILEAIKAETDMVRLHDERANANIDRICELLHDRERRFRRGDGER